MTNCFFYDSQKYEEYVVLLLGSHFPGNGFQRGPCAPQSHHVSTHVAELTPGINLW